MYLAPVWLRGQMVDEQAIILLVQVKLKLLICLSDFIGGNQDVPLCENNVTLCRYFKQVTAWRPSQSKMKEAKKETNVLRAYNSTVGLSTLKGISKRGFELV